MYDSYNPNQKQNESVLNDINIYENSYNSRVIYARKLYFMLLIQMLVIGGATYLVHANEDVDKFYEENHLIFWIGVFVCIAVATFVLFFRKLSRSMPINWILFTLFTLSSAAWVSYLVAIGDSSVGLLIFSSLASIVFFLFIYSLTVKKRLTYQGSTLFLSGSILFVFEMFTIFTDVALFWLMVVSLGAFLFAFFLIYDTQTSVNSGDKYDVTLEDEVSGSVVVYWDVLLLFLKTTELIRDFTIKERN